MQACTELTLHTSPLTRTAAGRKEPSTAYSWVQEAAGSPTVRFRASHGALQAAATAWLQEGTKAKLS